MSNAVNSYNVLIDRFKAFAAGHYLIGNFSHGQLDLIDLPKDITYPWLHVFPASMTMNDGETVYEWQVWVMDLPRDKDEAGEYIREAISDCHRIARDLVYEIDNGKVLFGEDIDLIPGATIIPEIREFTHTLTGVQLTFSISVPDDYDACEIPADYAVGAGPGPSTPGVGSLTFADSLENTDGIVTLDNDQDSPGATKYYGTNSQGVKGWYTLTGGGGGVASVTGESVDNTDPINPVVNAWPLAGTGTDLANGTIEVDPTFNNSLIKQDDGAGGFVQAYFGVGQNILLLARDASLNQGACDLTPTQASLSLNDSLGNNAGIAFNINLLSDSTTYPIVTLINSHRWNFNGVAAPTINDDDLLQYNVDSGWIYNGTLYICTDNTTGAAVWVAQGGGGSLSLETNGTPNGDQTLLNLVEGTNVTITDDGNGNVTISAADTDTGITELTGEVTAGPGSGSQAATIANDAVTFAKMQNINTQRVIGRNSAGSGDPQEVTLSQLLDWIGSAAQGDILYRGASGWARLAAGSSGRYLRTNGAGADPSWETVPAQDSMVLGQGFTASTVAAGATEYSALFNGTTADTGTNESLAQVPVVVGGTFSRLYYTTVSGQAGSGSYVVTVRVNGVDTAITLTIAAGSAAGVFTNLINTAVVAAGDLISLKLVNNASGASAQARSAQILLTR